MKPSISHPNTLSYRPVKNKYKKKHMLKLVALLLCPFAFTSLSQAATRVFYDGSESGNTNLWQQDDYHNKCTSVATAADGVAGPYAGSRMIRCNSNGSVAWNDPAKFETLKIPSFNMTNEVLYRVRVRVDKNHNVTAGSAKKILRLFSTSPTINDTYETIRSTTGGVDNEGLINGNQMNTYWGDASGDNTANSSNWHTIEYYFNKANGVVKIWHDNVLVRSQNFGRISGHVGETGDLYITSNFEDSHDTINYVYFDEFEAFTDSSSGTPTSGSMADGTITASGSSQGNTLSAPTNLQAN